jgi:hypothetical protein
MAGRPGKKSQTQQPSKPFDEFADDAEGFEEDVPAVDPKADPAAPGNRSRDWRDVEKYREQRELRRIIGDDLDDLLDGKPLPRKR